MKPSLKLPALFLVPAGLALLGAAAYGASFLYDMMQSSLSAGGSKYAVTVPGERPMNVKDAPACQQKTAKWLGCF
ncbi:MAG: hypothetical protein RJB38_1615 [Pseudomonadota bacterium]|jgi:hypothetical protein